MNKNKLIDDSNKILYERVRSHYKVNLKKSNDHMWGSHIKKDTVIISHSKTNHPIASFTHELLHIDTQLFGYRRIRRALSLNKETQDKLPRLCSCLDNEFQHHKMFEHFIELGFKPNEFYNDLDNEVIPYLENILKIPSQDLISLSIDYLTLIAPGGIITLDKIKELQQSFYNYDNKKYQKNFKAIDKIIKDWKADSIYDAEKYIINFFLVINAGQTWITYSDLNDLSSENFPSSGFFIDRAFTLEDVTKAFGQ